MEAAGIRSVITPPPLPKPASRESTPESDGESARTMNRRPVEQVERRAVTWKGESAAPGRPANPARETRPSGIRPASAPVPEKSPPPPARAATPSAAVARIVDAASQLRPHRGTQIRIALSPAHLGDLVIELVVRDSRLYGRVLAESASAKELIEGHLDDLRRGLERRGVEIGSLQVIAAEPGPENSEGALLRSLRRHVLDVDA